MRDPALRENGMLPAAFQCTAGDLLYDGLRNGLVVDGQVGTKQAPPCENTAPLAGALSSNCVGARCFPSMGASEFAQCCETILHVR